jgi:hypothetical protein
MGGIGGVLGASAPRGSRPPGTPPDHWGVS